MLNEYMQYEEDVIMKKKMFAIAMASVMAASLTA